jgi:HAD superfamily phosphatase (TIGR01668 family)
MIIPHCYVSCATRLDASYFERRNISGMLLDIDGTLKDFQSPAAPASTVRWIEQMSSAGLRMCLLSNGRAARIGPLAASLGLPFVSEAMKPSPRGCCRGLELLQLPAQRVALIGDQIFADVLAGRLAGLHTVLVRPTSRVEPWFTRIKRPLEAPIRLWLKRRLDAFDASC